MDENASFASWQEDKLQTAKLGKDRAGESMDKVTFLFQLQALVYTPFICKCSARPQGGRGVWDFI